VHPARPLARVHPEEEDVKNFIAGFVIGALLFGGGFAVASSYYDLDDVYSRIEEAESNIESRIDNVESTVTLWCD
jgi:hypothetical protein